MFAMVNYFNYILSGVKVLSGTFNGTGPDDCEGIMFVVKLSKW